MENKILITGFGGQGILFAGKLIAYTGLLQGLEVSWLPSYGPEMRGGTAYCSVIISDKKIGSPVVTKPDILVCMNAPSLDKFEDAIVPGGILIVDSTLIGRKSKRDDINVFYIPATQIADDKGYRSLANMVVSGKLIKESGICNEDILKSAIEKNVPERKKDLLGANLEALGAGYNYSA